MADQHKSAMQPRCRDTRWSATAKVVLSYLLYHHSQKQTQRSLGFTLVEVLVAMLVAAIFVSITMQAIVTAAAFRVRADQYDKAVSWIQEDLEVVLDQAKEYEMTAYPYSSLCDATVAASGFAAGFMTDDTLGLGGATTTFGPRTIGGKEFTLSRTADYSSSPDPFRLLLVTYTVSRHTEGAVDSEDKPIATVNTEVMPQAVLKCQ